ncbi:MAG: hypothetical protein KDA62_04970 [Planctomycetales bacterium]|nr:hypothetical protein [Planctomycetales bacterium]
MINWQYYPKSDAAPEIAHKVIAVFNAASGEIDSAIHSLESNAVLTALSTGLTAAGFAVESSKTAEGKVKVPVLFGRNGRLEKSFDADAFHRELGFVLEVEAGRGVVNNQFLKDVFQACMMHDVFYLGIAVRNLYRKSQDFDRVVRFFDTMYASNRLTLPLKGILVIGY